MERSAVASVLRSLQAYCGQLCDKETLSCGIAYTCCRYPTLCEVNQFREVVAEDHASALEAFEQAESWFADLGLVCNRWVPAGGEASAELEAVLVDKGFERVGYRVMELSDWPTAVVNEKLRVLPARAMRDAFRATFMADDAAGDLGERETRADSYAERLDDPPMEAFVAVDGKQPVGRCALFQVGEIGYVTDLAVLPPFAGVDVERALLGHVLTLALRLTLRPVCARVDATDDTTRSSLLSAGFAEVGRIVEFHRRATLPAGSAL